MRPYEGNFETQGKFAVPLRHFRCPLKGNLMFPRGGFGLSLEWISGRQKPFFVSIGCNRKLPSDAYDQVHPIDIRTSIGWKPSCPSDALSPFHRMRFHLSIRCALAFPSIDETFNILVCLWAQTPNSAPIYNMHVRVQAFLHSPRLNEMHCVSIRALCQSAECGIIHAI